MPITMLIYTDLDGTLLDHNTYSAQPASSALTLLKEKHIPIIPNTSKTGKEMEILRSELDLHGPYIVENGSVIHIPKTFITKQPDGTSENNDYWLKTFGKPRQYWVAILEEMTKKYPGCYEGFSKLNVLQLSELTGLSYAQAEAANSRAFSEPLRWLSSESQKQSFIKDMNKLGANVLQGGRFLSVCGQCDKGLALNWLTSALQKQENTEKFISVAVGDGENDNAMLEAADIAVQIRSPNHPFPKLKRTKQLIRSSAYGPAGWAECITQLVLEQFGTVPIEKC